MLDDVIQKSSREDIGYHLQEMWKERVYPNYKAYNENYDLRKETEKRHTTTNPDSNAFDLDKNVRDDTKAYR